MNILGIETSCDETAAAVVKEGTTLASSIVASQIEVHHRYGGVVPELASRKHIEAIIPVVDESLNRA
ncbi:MAG: tRNA (adenosine(37)-N6)-threonylcarbamoyltransferase complex transferase subunit TsaD, partial [Desulfobacterales bacterium]